MVVNVAMNMVMLWLSAAVSIWITWWAAQSRDPVALRAIAMATIIVPALVYPVINLVPMSESVAQRILVITLTGMIVGLARGLVLLVWAGVSHDPAYLRIAGSAAGAASLLAALLQAGIWLGMGRF